MTLSQFLSKTGMTHEAFGRLIGVQRLAVTRYISGERTPRPSIAKKIVKETKGKVSLQDIYK